MSGENVLAPMLSIGPFSVADASSAEVVEAVVNQASAPHPRPVLVYALHVGGLNHRKNPEFVRAMAEADMVYADGGSVVWLARRSGARKIERAPTTDVGWDILTALGPRLGRESRVALIGGPDGLARRAANEMEARCSTKVTYATHGFHQDWTDVLAAVAGAQPDLLIVGMGAPQEMVWCSQWRAKLPNVVVLTCGGWFGHIVGDERRAPSVLRRSGLEWIARVAQQPARLGPRYAKGIAATAALYVTMKRPRPLDRTAARE